MSEYDEQALSFLRNNDLKMVIKKSEFQNPPMWATEAGEASGYKYTVTLTSSRGAYTFPFWDSIHNRQVGKTPTKYDVLAALTIWEGSIDDFTDEFGYEDTKTSKTIEIYNSVIDQTLQLKHILPTKALNALQEIN